MAFKWCGARLRDARVRAGLTQGALAKRIDATRAASLRTCISRWETDTHPPSAAAMMAICKALRIKPASLYD